LLLTVGTDTGAVNNSNQYLGHTSFWQFGVVMISP
jgi:hypothetical protein